MAQSERSSDSSGATPRSAVSLRSLGRRFADVVAVDGIDLDIRDGEFFSMLGPSGSGKTTVLRLIAGFEQPDSGTVWLAGDDVTRRAPFERDVNTVFQDYALFPHLNVRDNVAYGLRVRGVRKARRRELADQALAQVQLASHGDRRPTQLSGGQRQRVALARALVIEPKVLLLDEPLGALDLKLRQQMQGELKGLQRDVGITFVFVTHDQDEALTMSDRIAVFNGGRIEQVGSPAEIYEHPASEFVANFVGTSNLITGEAAQKILGRDGTFSVRPEKLLVNSDAGVATHVGVGTPAGMDSASGVVADVVYAGASTRIVVDLDAGTRLVALQQNLDAATDVRTDRGAPVRVSWHTQHLIALDERS